jgi:hypothetical protein
MNHKSLGSGLPDIMDLLYISPRELVGQPEKHSIQGDASDELLLKLETAGKVPSKDKFRCMVCWVRVAFQSCTVN